MQITLDRTQPINYNVQTFWFKPEKPINYTAGQFIEMYLPHSNPDERGIKHWFTLSSSPSEPLISITTKYAGPKGSSFKKTLFSLKLGASVKIVEPMGDFVLPKDTRKPLVFVAGGIGVTPFRSMVKWLTDNKQSRKIQILLAANKPEDIIFEKLFSTYGASVIKLVSEPGHDWTGEVGRLSADKILALTGPAGDKQIYVSGPEPMVETLEKELLASGVKKAHLVFDFFPGYTPDLK